VVAVVEHLPRVHTQETTALVARVVLAQHQALAALQYHTLAVEEVGPPPVFRVAAVMVAVVPVLDQALQILAQLILEEAAVDKDLVIPLLAMAALASLLFVIRTHILPQHLQRDHRQSPFLAATEFTNGQVLEPSRFNYQQSVYIYKKTHGTFC
jgi:hypothetical protein